MTTETLTTDVCGLGDHCPFKGMTTEGIAEEVIENAKGIIDFLESDAGLAALDDEPETVVALAALHEACRKALDA